MDRVRPGLRVWKAMPVPLATAGIQLVAFAAMRRAFVHPNMGPPAPMEWLWVKDLYTPQATVLSLAFGALVATQLWIAVRGMESGLNGPPHPQIQKMLNFYGGSAGKWKYVLAGLTAFGSTQMPPGLVLFLTAGAMAMACQSAAFENPSIRAKLGLIDLRFSRLPADEPYLAPLPVAPKGVPPKPGRTAAKPGSSSKPGKTGKASGDTKSGSGRR
eukprot:RCo053939